MLGKFSRGMKVAIPAKFQDANKQPVSVENVVVGIEFFDKHTNRILNILNETQMNCRGDGDYIYEYSVPPNAEEGNYIVRIKAKHLGSKSNLIEATDYFEISHNMVLQPILVEKETPQEQVVQLPEVKRAPVSNDGKRRVLIEDHVFDAYGSVVVGAHINVYEKNSFIPKSPSNVKVASALTNTDGRWSLTLLPGDYVFTFIAPNTKEVREFRKIQ